MPRGTPDGRISTFAFASQAADLAQIVNNLWGFSPLDGQGRIIYMDTFNNGLGGWQYGATGAAIAPRLIIGAYCFSPPYAVEINAGVVTNDYSQLFREMYMGQSTRIGMEFGLVINGNVARPEFSLDYNPISFSPLIGKLRFNRASGLWEVLRPGAVWQGIYQPGNPPGTQNMHIQVKLVMDFATGRYIRAMIGDTIIALNAPVWSLETSSSSYNGLMIAAARGVCWGAAAAPFNLGYCIITKDEP